MNNNTHILLTGNRDMASAFLQRLQTGGYGNLPARAHSEPNLLDHRAAQYRQMIGDQIDGRSKTMRLPFSG